MTTVTSYSFTFVQIFAVTVSSFDRLGFRSACARYASVREEYVIIRSVTSTTIESSTFASSSGFIGRRLLQGGSEGTRVEAQVALPEGGVSDPAGAARRLQSALQSQPASVFAGTSLGGRPVRTERVDSPSQQSLDFRRMPNGNLVPTALLRAPDANGRSAVDVLRNNGVTLG